MLNEVIFDIETDGFLDEATVVHSLCLMDIEESVIYSYTDNNYTKKHGSIIDGLKHLEKAKAIIGHNIIQFDLPALRKIYKWEPGEGQEVVDTMVMSKLLYPNIKDIDDIKIGQGKIPGFIRGRHSLEAWGYRLGNFKGEYAKDIVHVYNALREAGYEVVKEGEEYSLVCINGDLPEWEIVGHGSDFVAETALRKLDLKTEPFKTWSPDMQEYCEVDVNVNSRLYISMREKPIADKAFWLEHEASTVCEHIERCGFKFNKEKGEELLQKLVVKRAEVHDKLVEAFGSWWAPATSIDSISGLPKVVIPKRTSNRSILNCEALPPRTVQRYHKVSGKPLKPKEVHHKALYTEGSPYTPLKWQTFEPGSRDQVANRLIVQYGWEPTELTRTGKPQVNDETLDALTHIPECSLLQEYYLLDKRIGALGEGDKAWLSKTDEDGFLRGRYNVNGAVTGRATHNDPNIAQVPAADEKVPHGKECRELFGVPDGWVLLGSDLSGLELRCLGHFMSRWDEGAYLTTLLEGDIHWENSVALGLVSKNTQRDEHNDWHNTARNKIAKTFIYAFLYGAGDEKLGKIYTKYSPLSSGDIKTRGKNTTILNQLVRQGVKPTAEKIATIYTGKLLKQKFLKALPALANLSHNRDKPSHLDKILKKRKKQFKKMWLNGLDGRELHVRREYAALNTLLQSAGALICKAWMVFVFKELCRIGLRPGYQCKDGNWLAKDGGPCDFAICAWVHDELQIGCRPEHAEKIGEVCEKMAIKAGEFFDFKAPVEATYDTGSNWASTH